MLFQDTVDKACRTVQPAAHTSGRDNVFILRSLLIKPAGQSSQPLTLQAEIMSLFWDLC